MSRWLLRLFGWRLVFVPPPGPKGVVIVYPHTSNWDFPIGVLARSAMALAIGFVAKDNLFKPPLGAIFRWLGGIPVNRRIRTGFTAQLVARYHGAESLFIAIAPEGTRSHVPHLKSGFYHLAVQAGVPLGTGFIDYGRKEVGIDAWLTLSGDPATDMATLRQHYRQRRGRRPALAGELRLADETPGGVGADRPTS